jgi:uncharacterized membrane protein
MRDRGTLGGNYGRARGINDLGLVVGLSEITPWSYQERGFVWDSIHGISELSALPVPGGVNNSKAYAVNALGHIAGVAINAVGERTAVLWDPRANDWGSLSGGYSEVYAINNADLMAGMSTVDPGGTPGHACLWSSGSARDIGHIAGYEYSYGKGMSAGGDIVGYGQEGKEHGIAAIKVGASPRRPARQHRAGTDGRRREGTVAQSRMERELRWREMILRDSRTTRSTDRKHRIGLCVPPRHASKC